MDMFETLFSRKSIRSYTGEPATREELEQILLAADAAPIGMGQYDRVHLTIVEDADLLAQIDRAGAELLGKPGAHPLYGAPTLILVSAALPGPDMENVMYSNAALVAHNMALAGTALGLGVCHIWGAAMAVNSKPGLLAAMCLPDGFELCSGVIVGKTACGYAPRDIKAGRISRSFL